MKPFPASGRWEGTESPRLYPRSLPAEMLQNHRKVAKILWVGAREEITSEDASAEPGGQGTTPAGRGAEAARELPTALTYARGGFVLPEQ